MRVRSKMDCKQFEKLILDYIDGNLDKELSQICYHHLSNCPDCTELNENYKSIRSEIKRVERESPSADVLQSIREHAREQGIIKKTPFYKKWFYSPILVPTVAAAVTLLIVLNTNEEYMNRQNPAESKVRVSKSTEKFDGKKIADSGIIAGDQKKKSLREPYKNADTADESGHQLEDSDKFAAGKSETKELREMSSDPGSPAKMRQQVSEPNLTSPKPEKGSAAVPSTVANVPEEDTVFRRQLNKVTLLQYQGNCVESIKEADRLLNSEPGPPAAIKKNAYTSQAECYEEIGNYSKAVDVYRKIQEMEPSVNPDISTKIEALNSKINQINSE